MARGAYYDLAERGWKVSSTIKGELIFAGDLIVNGGPMTGMAIQCEREALMGVSLPMYREVEIQCESKDLKVDVLSRQRNVTQLQWISSSDSLPDDDMTVLIALDDGEVWAGFIDAGVWRYVSADAIEGTVTHWAEFPVPPGQ